MKDSSYLFCLSKNQSPVVCKINHSFNTKFIQDVRLRVGILNLVHILYYDFYIKCKRTNVKCFFIDPTHSCHRVVYLGKLLRLHWFTKPSCYRRCHKQIHNGCHHCNPLEEIQQFHKIYNSLENREVYIEGALAQYNHHSTTLARFRKKLNLN